ncbi:MAG: M56 family metallopeptidase [Flavobacterium sp.]
MIDFLIKSGVCLAVFLGFYHLLLQKEKMHQFNRFYLLASIAISLALPFITFEIVKIVPVAEEIAPMPQMPVSLAPAPEKLDYVPFIIWTLYGLITSIALIRFGKNIRKLIAKSQTHPNVKYKNAVLVLVDERTLPHTFLNKIFINSEDYNQRNIEDELYLHELAHVSQKHTLDVLFIEFLKAIFWFNPVFILYKKAIQLNHEFLADARVVESYNDVPFYQNLLLQKGSGNNTIYLASNLNYLVTKKRLIMMTKNTSKTMALIKKAAVAPILAGLIYLFCIDVVAQEKAVSAISINKNTPIDDKTRDTYYKGVWVKVHDQKIGKKISAPYESLTLEEKRKYLDYVPKAYQKKMPSQKEYADFKNPKKYAVWINFKHVPNSQLDKYQPSDFAYFSGSAVLKNARSKRFPQPYQFTLCTNDYFEKNMKNSHLKFSGDTVKIGISDYNKALKSKKPAKIKADTLVWYKNEQKDDSIFNVSNLTEQPEFEGGMTGFYKFIGINYKIPDEVSAKKLKGRVHISFIIEKDGSLSDIKILKDMGYGAGEEAQRVLKDSPKWKPGKKDGQAVRTMYSLPISVVGE